jgi:hypothetical protein
MYGMESLAYIMNLEAQKKVIDGELNNVPVSDPIETIKYLINTGYDPRSNDDAALISASFYGNFKAIDYLIALGCDPCSQNYEALTESYSFNVFMHLLNHLTKKDKYVFLSRCLKLKTPIKKIYLDKTLRKNNMLKVILKPKSLRIQMILI